MTEIESNGHTHILFLRYSVYVFTDCVFESFTLSIVLYFDLYQLIVGSISS
jgi:hypothetical protein